MPIKLGSLSIAKVYKGNTEITDIYKGSDKVYSSEEPFIPNPRFIVVGQKGVSISSSDGYNWVGIGGLSSFKDYYSVAYGEDAYGIKKYVCVGRESGGVTGGSICISLDGTSWTVVRNNFPYGFYSVCYGNGRFVCVGLNGTSYYSIDGTNWNTMSGLNTSRDYNSVGFGNGKFFTVGNNGYCAYSTNGTSWNSASGLHSTYFYATAYGNNIYVCSGYQYTYNSIDGAYWQNANNIVSSRYLYGMCYGEV